MSDTTVTMNEFEQIKAAMEAEHRMREIEQRTSMWIEERKAMANRSMRQQIRAVQNPPPPTEPELPAAGELECCIRQAPVRWQGVVMAAVTLQGRSVAAAVDAVGKTDISLTQEAKAKLGNQTATELLEKERDRRHHCKMRRITKAKSFQAGYGGSAMDDRTVRQWQEEASRAMAKKMDEEMLETYTNRMNSVINPSISKYEDIS